MISDNKLLDELFDKNDGVKKRESTTLEFKEVYNKDDLVRYIKIMAGFANAKGGYIIFGIKDNPRTLVGINSNSIEGLKSEVLTEILNNHFDPEINWELLTPTRSEKQLAVLYVKESINKPVMCKKLKQSPNQKHLIEEGRIYYRYNSQTKEIKYSELKNLLNEQQEMENKRWRELILNIAQAKPQNVALLNLATGNMPYQADKTVIIDQALIKQIKFIKEGKFVESDGAPALKLIGEVEGVNLLKENISLSEWMTTMELGEKLNMPKGRSGLHPTNQIIKHHKIKNNPKYYQSKKNQHYYSQECYLFLKEFNYSADQAKLLNKEVI
ncbi:MAG: ATP-binding protein [Burkholderiales bacterium]|nr:ATP-binding protein [Burkholderiales bacterium]